MQKYAQALQLFRQEEFGAALRVLQDILNGASDGFLIDPTEDDATASGLKAAAGQLVDAIVRRDPKVYERMFGGTAQKLFKQAFGSNDVEQLSAVAGRFFHTRAGNEAAYHLAAFYFDHDQPSLAAAWYERVHGSPTLEKGRQSSVALQMAICQLRIGDADASRATLAQLRSVSPAAHVTCGNRQIPWFEANEDPIDWLRRDFAPNSASEPTHPARAAGWTVSVHDAESMLDNAVSILHRGGPSERAMPSLRLRPILVDDTLVGRTLENITAVDLRTGRRLWESPSDETLAVYRATYDAAHRKRPAHVVMKLVEQRLEHDATYGTITSDGMRVFSIDGLGLAFGYRDAKADRYVLPTSTNRLVARDLQNGDVVWDRVSSETFFLGAPVAVDGDLYGLAEVRGQIKLQVRNPATGKLQWSQALASPGFGIVDDFHRRLAGLVPAVMGDVIVCPTGTGSVVALRRSDRALLWAYTPTYGPGDSLSDAATANPNRHPASGKGDWLDASVTLAAGKVIVKPRGSGHIHCLDLHSGSLAWKQPCGDALFAAGVSNGNIILVHARSVTALQLANGQPAWATPATMNPIAGRGVIDKGRLHLPLTTGDVAAIDLNDGRLVAQRRIAKAFSLGNLAAIPGGAVSQTAHSLRSFPLAVEKLDVVVTGLPAITPALVGQE
ncbi:MAG: PQQ-binding-like beta-propeller repeat protein [Planctomycetaceae bacterium]